MVNVHATRLNAAGALFLALLSLLGLTACPPTPVSTPTTASLPANAAGAAVRWRVSVARGQSAYIPLDLPVMVPGGSIALLSAGLAPPGNPAAGPRILPWPGAVRLFSPHMVHGAVEGPTVEQLTGQPRIATDAGSYLVPLKAAPESNGRVFEMGPSGPLYVRLTVPPVMDAGEYRIGLRLEVPGRPVEQAALAVEVSDVAVPAAARVLAVATTTVQELTQIYPGTFGKIAGQYLDPADPEHQAAARQFDGLVKAARAQGVALFVEDIRPAMRIDELGKVELDWDAYDRLMQPYMDGSAFEDRVPLAVWLAPVPPLRIRDSSTQLWQYIDLCAKHFAARRWTAAPAFLHPVIGGGTAEQRPNAQAAADAERRRALVNETMRLHMPRNMLAVAAPGADLPHAQLWAVNDCDPRLPPAGALADEYSVRAWPWLCVARGNLSGAGGIGGNGGTPTGVKGFVWRDALRGAGALGGSANPATDPQSLDEPLLVAPDGILAPTLRMVWLEEGLNDAALLGLLERRADASRVGMMAEILAGMVGRTGLADGELSAGPAAQPAAATGYLYAGWPPGRALWDHATPNLLQLILASDPGTRAQLNPDDPAYLAAKLWLAGTRRPVARIAGYDLAMRPGLRGGDILDARLRVRLENPVDAAAELDLRFPVLPGDFEIVPPSTSTTPGSGAPATTDAPVDDGGGFAQRGRRAMLPASSVTEMPLSLAGHVEALMEAPQAETLEITEHFNGAVLRLPVRLPVYRMHRLENGQTPPKMDGIGDDWPLDNQTRVFGQMKVDTRYLARPDLLAGALRRDDPPALLRWTYDADYLYLLARCPQHAVSDDRNTDWPLQSGVGGGARWWGADGLQIELAPMPSSSAAPATDAPDRLLKIAFKPSGVALVRSGYLQPDVGGMNLLWKDGPPPMAPGHASSLQYGITIERNEGRITGYTLEAAIPRAWVETAPAPNTPGTPAAPALQAPAWRLNVLRHRAADLISSSWSGPLVNDDDVAMMGALIGQ